MLLIYWVEAYHCKAKQNLLVTSKEIGLEVRPDKTKYVVMSRD